MITLLKSATIVDKNSKHHLQKKDVLIEKGIITNIANTIKKPDNCTVVKLENLHISVGWFDTSVSFGEPGFEERETIENGLKTAQKSGFTAVAVNANTQPVTDNKASVEYLINKAQNSAVALYCFGSLTKGATGENIAEMYDMAQSGAIAFGDYKKPIENPTVLKIALQYAQNFNGLIQSFPQNNAIANNGLANEGKNSTLLGLKGIPALAEELQIARDLFLLEYTGGKLHIPTISTEKSVKLIKEAKKKGLDVTCSVASHNLVLTDDELATFDSNAKVLPPLRTKKDVKALQKAVIDGTIDCITSDHNPIDIEHKKVAFNSAKFGTIGLESLFGSLSKHLPLEHFIDCLSNKPRARFNIENYTIAKGENANLTLFTTEGSSEFSEEKIIATSKNSIFLNKTLNGKVYGIFANKKLHLND